MENLKIYGGFTYELPTNSIEERILQNGLDAQKAQYLEDMKNHKKLELDQARESFREAHRERRKAQCEVVSIDANGIPNIRTENLLIPTQYRKLCNFQNPDLIELRNPKNGEIHFRFESVRENQRVVFFISGSKCGNGRYLLKKFNAAGCEIFASSLRKQEQYLMKLWTKLRADCNKYVYVPERIGWQTDENGSYIFVKEGAFLWNDLCNMIR